MGLEWQRSDNYWYAVTAEDGDPTRSTWRIVDAEDSGYDVIVESGITKQPAQKIATYPTVEDAKRAAESLHDAGEL